MGFLRSSCSFTRYKIIEKVSSELWQKIPEKLQQYAFQDIDDTSQERSWGWTNFDDMLDVNWNISHPEKGEYLAFALRLETRRIPPAVLKKHLAIALQKEKKNLQLTGKKFLSQERKSELHEQVRLRLFKHFLPIPAVFDVVWSTTTNIVYLSSTHIKLIDLFTTFFTLTFDLHLELQTPYNLAVSLLDTCSTVEIGTLEPTKFV